MSASPNPVASGGILTYTIALTSKGPDFPHSGTLQCTLVQLNKGDTYTVKLTVRVNAAADSTIKDAARTVSKTQHFVKSNNTGTVTKVD